MAMAICDYLESFGLRCWIAPRNVNGGRLYSEEIIDGIKSSPVFLLLFSASSNLSKHVLSELDVAFNSEKTVLPFCLDDSGMSEAMSYYLTATHRIDAFPDPSARFEDLRTSIISNIPELASERDKARMFKAIAEELGLSVEELKRIKTASRVSNEFEDSWNEDFFDGTSEDGKSPYQILINDKQEILLLMHARKSNPTNPLLVIDPISRYVLLYRNPESTTCFNDIAKEANIAIRATKEITVVEEAKDELIREYKVPVREVKDVRALFDEDSDSFCDLTDLYEYIDSSDDSDDKNVKQDGYVPIALDSDYEEIDEESVLLYQENGVCIISTRSGFIVPRELTENEVSILDRDEKAFIITPNIPPSKDEDEDGEDWPLLQEWMKSMNAIDNAICVKSKKVKSILHHLSEKWNSPSVV